MIQEVGGSHSHLPAVLGPTRQEEVEQGAVQLRRLTPAELEEFRSYASTALGDIRAIRAAGGELPAPEREGPSAEVASLMAQAELLEHHSEQRQEVERLLATARAELATLKASTPDRPVTLSGQEDFAWKANKAHGQLRHELQWGQGSMLESFHSAGTFNSTTPRGMACRQVELELVIEHLETRAARLEAEGERLESRARGRYGDSPQGQKLEECRQLVRAEREARPQGDNDPERLGEIGRLVRGRTELRSGLEHEDSAVRASAADLARERGTVQEALEPQLPDNEESRQLFLDSLVARPGQVSHHLYRLGSQGHRLLAGAWLTGDESTREAVAGYLRRLHPATLVKAVEETPELLPVLAESLAGEDNDFSFDNRLQALARLDSEESRAALLQLAGDPESGAAAAAGLARSEVGQRLLTRGLTDPNLDRQRACLKAAQFVPKDVEAGREEMLAAAVAGVDSPDPEIRQLARDLVDRFGLYGNLERDAERAAYGAVRNRAERCRASDPEEAARLDEVSDRFSRLRYPADPGRQREVEAQALGEDAAEAEKALTSMGPEALRLLEGRLQASDPPRTLTDLIRDLRERDPRAYRRLIESRSKLDQVLAEDSPVLADLGRQKEFQADLKPLLAERQALMEQGLASDAQQTRIEDRVREHEDARYEAWDTDEAGRLLGDSLESLQTYVGRQRLEPAVRDRILHKAADARRSGHGEAVDRLLQLSAEDPPDPEELELFLELMLELPVDNVEAAARHSQTTAELREGFANLGLRLARESAQGQDRGLFQGQGRDDSLGERLTDYLVEQGKAADLMVGLDGEPSLLDRLARQRDPEARASAQRILDATLYNHGDRPPEAQSRLAELKAIQLDLAQTNNRPRDPEQVLEELQRLREFTPGSELDPLVRAEISTTAALVLGARRLDASGPELEQAVDQYGQLLRQLDADQRALPDGRRTKRLAADLAAAQQILQCRKMQADQRLKEEHQRQQLDRMMHVDGEMSFEAIRGLILLAVDSPTDSLSLQLKAKAGVQVRVPFVGTAEAYVYGSLKAQLSMTEEGGVAVTLKAAAGVGAGIEIRDKVGARGEAEKFTELTYVFANEDEAARFIQSISMELSGEDDPSKLPSYNEPIKMVSNGTRVSLEGEVPGVKGSLAHERKTIEAEYPVPWLWPESQPTRMETVTQEGTIDIRLKDGKQITLGVEATDLTNSKNQVANGTSLTFSAGAGLAGSGENLVEDLLTWALESDPQLFKDLPGDSLEAKKNLARQRLQKAFRGAQVKGAAQIAGKAEYTAITQESLMLEEGKNGAQVLLDFLRDQVRGEGDWNFHTSRKAVESSAEVGARFSYGAVVSVFLELGLKLETRDATTVVGSLQHARQMLYGVRRDVPLSESQFRELEKDGLVRWNGSVDKDEFSQVLGTMREEMAGRYADPEWRRQHLPEGMTAQEFQKNVDEFLRDVSRSTWAGLQNNGRVYSTYEEFARDVGLEALLQEPPKALDQG